MVLSDSGLLKSIEEHLLCERVAPQIKIELPGIEF
jgi:hypothetical protein